MALHYVWYSNIKPGIQFHKRVGYTMDIMRQSAYLVVNPIAVDSYFLLFKCTTVGQVSDLMTALTSSFNLFVGGA